MSSSVTCKQLPKDLELAYVSFVGIVMAAYIASEYHDDVENKIVGYAPEGVTYPFPPQTRLPALNFFITLASILLAIVVYFLMKAIKKRILAKLLTYRCVLLSFICRRYYKINVYIFIDSGFINQRH